MRDPASFRDRDGYVFHRDGEVFRRIFPAYAPHFRRLMESGLYERLVSDGLLVSHQEIGAEDADGGRTIRPERVPFVSYPYEWCFSQFQEAALATLAAQKTALRHGMILKDASAYNVQFIRGKAALIDTLSFEEYRAGRPWMGYRQFCEHFLAPLAFMAFAHDGAGLALRLYPDGIPLRLASSRLPWRTWTRASLLLHIHLHAAGMLRLRPRAAPKRGRAVRALTAPSLLALAESLERGVRRLKWRPREAEWAGYYEDGGSYSAAALEHKERFVADCAAAIRPSRVWDFGSNDGRFSRIAAKTADLVVAFDRSPAAVESNWVKCRETGSSKVLPLVMDLANPSPSIGWMHEERRSLADRGPADMGLALALLHHLFVSHNLPFERMADGLSRLCRRLIVEFVPSEDPQFQRVAAGRFDAMSDYSREGFESAFASRFRVARREPIRDSRRVLYLMEPV